MSLSIILATATDHPTPGTPCLSFDHLGVIDRDHLIKSAGVPMARRHSFASILAIAAARNCLRAQDLGDARIGVIATGGSNHLDVAWTLTKGIIDEGSEFIDPLGFPHSIPSSIAASVALACKATAFAIGVGHSSRAFFEALLHSSRLIKAECADAVLVVAVHHSSPVTAAAARHGFGCDSVGSAMCALLTPTATTVPALDLLNIQTFYDVSHDASNMFDNLPSDRIFGEQMLGELKADCAFAATGGRLLIEAACEMSSREGNARHLPFAVTLMGRQQCGLLVAWNNHLDPSRINFAGQS